MTLYEKITHMSKLELAEYIRGFYNCYGCAERTISKHSGLAEQSQCYNCTEEFQTENILWMLNKGY